MARVEHAFTRLLGDGMTTATARRVFSTLRAGLNAAAREGLIPRSPARYGKLPRGRRPFAVVWTKRRVEEWRKTGERPVVAVWEPGQLTQFLPSIAGHPLFPLFRLVGMRRLRRGEACELQWGDLDLDDGLACIARRLQEDARAGWTCVR